jgi:hypothetical protein
MKKPQFSPGEEVIIISGDRAKSVAVIETIEPLFKEINEDGTFKSTKRVIPKNVFIGLQKQGIAELKDDIWYFHERRTSYDTTITYEIPYKFHSYRYFMRHIDGGSLFTVKTYRIRNRLKYEAKAVAERLMRSK